MFSKIPPRQILLLLLMLLIGAALAKRYLTFVALPTSGRIAERTRILESRRGDLKVAQRAYELRQAEIGGLQQLAESYWLASGQRSAIDQEINREFGKIIRKAQLPASHRIDVQRNKLPGVNHIQEVQIRLELRGISMKETARLLAEVHRYGRKLTWSYCRLEPDNPRTPKTVNLSAKLRALVIDPEASDFLLSGGLPAATAAAKTGAMP